MYPSPLPIMIASCFHDKNTKHVGSSFFYFYFQKIFFLQIIIHVFFLQNKKIFLLKTKNFGVLIQKGEIWQAHDKLHTLQSQPITFSIMSDCLYSCHASHDTCSTSSTTSTSSTVGIMHDSYFTSGNLFWG